MLLNLKVVNVLSHFKGLQIALTQRLALIISLINQNAELISKRSRRTEQFYNYTYIIYTWGFIIIIDSVLMTFVNT